MGKNSGRSWTKEQRQELMNQLKERFEKNTQRHIGIKWALVQERLEAKPEKMWSLFEMERTGGEPDIIGHDKSNDQYIFCDCSAESPSGRRSLCYDKEALDSRKENKPTSSVIDMASEMGVDLMTEAEYLKLQELGPFDQKTSSWLRTPEPIRKSGGAIFGDFRYGRTFIYHNGASSYYAARGFRALVRV